ncbi:hypothetical protein [Pareuzebyella sediminis]|uniref:hypothetical protein n=1 Tax=Pareuzebyella sediminis TaxID=2607998 RepID=UPI0011ECD1F9|nr:hypothetical protein [Pareuzebyella sediminis]
MQILHFKKLIIAFLLLPLIALANNEKGKGRYTKEKTIKRAFNVNSNALLKVENSYGNLNITSWNENRILIEVHIKTNGDNEEKVQQKLEDISVDFESSTSMVSARTDLHTNKSGWGWNWGKSSNVNMQINYTIKVPVKNNIQLSNDYGGILLDRIDGHAKISCDYGRLEIGELRGRENQLSFDYTSKSTIGFINSGTISADYSGFIVTKAGDLIINADYSDSSVEQMENLRYNCDYGKIEIGEAQNIEGRGDYINVNLGTLHGNVDIAADYGSLKIGKMAEDAGNLSVKSNYTGVKIGYHTLYNFNFEIRASYAGVSGKEDFEISRSEEKNSSVYYKGYFGASNSGNLVTITSDYGGISFHKN